MPDFSRLSQAFLTCFVAIILASCNTTTDTSYEPETQLSDRKVVETVQKDTSNKISPRLEAKLAQRKTINIFKAWDSPGTFGDVYEKHCGLYWTVEAKAPSHTLTLNQINWAFNYPRFSYDDYPRVQKFTLNTAKHTL